MLLRLCLYISRRALPTRSGTAVKTGLQGSPYRGWPSSSPGHGVATGSGGRGGEQRRAELTALPGAHSTIPMHGMSQQQSSGHRCCHEGTSFTFCHVHQVRLRAEHESESKADRMHQPKLRSSGLQSSAQYSFLAASFLSLPVCTHPPSA